MFIVSLRYLVSTDIIDQHLEKHTQFLIEQYRMGHFIISGRQVPRTGGVIIATVKEREQLDRILMMDPFYQNKLASYEIVEFNPTMTCKELSYLMQGKDNPEICQSCGMPLFKDPKGGGSHADKSKSTEFCSFCYEKGHFTDERITLEEKINKNVQIGVAVMGLTEQEARLKAESIIPFLERWK
jgi:uncharacterized protein YciI